MPPGITRRPSLPDSADGARARNSAGVLAANGSRRTPIRLAALPDLGVATVLAYEEEVTLTVAVENGWAASVGGLNKLPRLWTGR